MEHIVPCTHNGLGRNELTCFLYTDFTGCEYILESSTHVQVIHTVRLVKWQAAFASRRSCDDPLLAIHRKIQECISVRH